MNDARNNVHAEFVVHIPVHDPIAQCLALTGSTRALGCWNTDDAIVADFIGPETWQATAYIPKNETLQWKWLMLDRDARTVKRSEDYPDRELKVFDDDLLVETYWGGQEEVTPISLWNASDDENKAAIDKRIVKSWNRNNSYHPLHGQDSDKCQRRKARDASQLKVRFAEEVCEIEDHRLNVETASDHGSSLDGSDNEIANWKKIADYGLPLGLISGAAALGVFIFKKLM